MSNHESYSDLGADQCLDNYNPRTSLPGPYSYFSPSFFKQPIFNDISVGSDQTARGGVGFPMIDLRTKVEVRGDTEPAYRIDENKKKQEFGPK
jgi:hypothetical protein